MDTRCVVIPPVTPVDEATHNTKASSGKVTMCCAMAYAPSHRCCAQDGKMGNNTIKTHLMLHQCEDIFDHSVPDNVNTAYAESAHMPMSKLTSRNTQEKGKTFHKASC